MLTPEEIKKLEIELSGDNKEAALKRLIKSIDDMVNGFNAMKLQVDNISLTCDRFKKVAEDNEKACLDLTQTIKNIHIALNTHREVLPPELEALANELGKFVMSGAAIKAGVKSNANA